MINIIDFLSKYTINTNNIKSAFFNHHQNDMILKNLKPENRKKVLLYLFVIRQRTS